jgi:hypothetical protein
MDNGSCMASTLRDIGRVKNIECRRYHHSRFDFWPQNFGFETIFNNPNQNPRLALNAGCCDCNYIIFLWIASKNTLVPEVLVRRIYYIVARRNGGREPLVARNGNLTSMLSCRLRTCKTGFIFCAKIALFDCLPCLIALCKILKISSLNNSLETCRLFSQHITAIVVAIVELHSKSNLNC